MRIKRGEMKNYYLAAAVWIFIVVMLGTAALFIQFALPTK